MTPHKIRVVLADRQAVFRELVKMLLPQRFKRFQVVAECSSGDEAIELCKKHQPDLLLTEFSLDQAFGGTFLHVVRQKLPDLRIVVLSNDPSETVSEVLRKEIQGHVLKTESLHELELALETVALGGQFFSPHARRQSLGDSPALSQRQQEVLRLVANGLSTKEIAHQLNISAKTADHHRARLMKKLDLHDTVSVVRYALRSGISVL